MKTNPKMHRGFTLVELLVVIVIIATLASFAAPQVMKQVKRADQAQATNNARQIGIALFEFEHDYSSFPDDSTAVAVKEATDTVLVTESSNLKMCFMRKRVTPKNLIMLLIPMSKHSAKVKLDLELS